MNKFINKVINAMLMSMLVFFGIAYKTAIVNAEDNSYTVTIPTAITYSNMNVGEVDISNDYTVNVHGDLDASKAVKVTATANPLTTTGGETLDNAVKQTKLVWAPDEAINTGSDSNDTVTITGTAKVADSYKGTVVYSATLTDNEKKYTIAYNANSGSGTMPNQEYTYNSKQILNKNSFSKDNKHFIGWSLTPETTAIQIFHDDKEYINCTYRESNYGYADLVQIPIDGPFQSGGVYTLDFDAKSNIGTSLLNTYFYGSTNYLSVSDVSNSDGFHDTNRPDGWNPIHLISQEYKHYTVKFVLGSNGDATVPKYILFRVFKGGGTLSFKNITVCKIVGSLDYFDGDNVDKITPKPGPTNLYAIWTIPNAYNFDYTGTVQNFIAPVDGTYKLEAWGASGGSAGAQTANDYHHYPHPGFGGYSTGSYKMNKGQKIYVIVGGKGTYTPSAVGGGYNGGGGKIESRVNNGAFSADTGGGMTHISTTNNPVSDDSDWNPAGTILVAGGGGGDDNEDSSKLGEADDGTGGSGGGFKGGAPHSAGNLVNHIGGYKPGKGEKLSYLYLNTPYTADGGGGGGGWLGGYASTDFNTGAYGGSGYIDTSVLTDAHMAGFEVEASNDTTTKTISVSNASADPEADVAKIGNGYARITLLSTTD